MTFMMVPLEMVQAVRGPVSQLGATAPGHEVRSRFPVTVEAGVFADPHGVQHLDL